MNTGNSKRNEPHKFVLNLSQRLDLRISNAHVTLRSLSICYTWKIIKKQYKNNKLKIIAPTWNDKFELPDGSYPVSDIQSYSENHKTLTTISFIDFYINRINNRLALKMKDGHKLELQTP